MKSKYRVVHLPTSVGGNPQGISKHLQELGLESETWIFQQNVFNYPGTHSIWAPTDGALKREVKRFLAIVKVALNFNIIHFNYGSGWATPIPMFNKADAHLGKKIKRISAAVYLELLSLFELNLYRLFRRKMFVHYQGDDARQGDFCKSTFSHSIAQYTEDGYYYAESDALKRRLIRRMSKNCEQVYAVNPDLLHVLDPKARFIPYSHISLAEWTPVYNQLENRPLRIGHAPSHRRVKGTDIILPVLEELAAEGFAFELILIEGLSNAEARREYEKIDVMIDQLHAGWYGGLAVELMALGKPVMVFIREEDLKFIPSEMRTDLPVLRIEETSLKEDLLKLFAMTKDEILQLGVRSRSYVEKWHDPLKIAEEIKRDYDIAFKKKSRK